MASPASPLHFNKIPSLGYHSATALLQDRQGFVWIGTQEEGLFRYDGYSAVRYMARLNDPHSLPHSRVIALHQDVDGRIWVGTRGGLARFNPETNDFTTIQFAGKSGRPMEVRTIVADGKHGLWVGFRGSGIQHLDLSSGAMTAYQHSDKQAASLAGDDINALAVDRKGGLWASTWPGGLDYLAPGSKDFVHYRISDDNDLDPKRNNSRALMFDRHNVLWIGTDAGMLTWADGAPWPARERLRTNAHFNQLLQGSDGSVWAGTITSGLLRFRPGSDTPQEHVFRANDPYSLPGDHVRTIMLDRTGQIWVGTLGNGIALADTSRTGFERFIPFDVEPDNRTPRSLLESIEGAPGGRLWLGNYGGGVTLFDPATGEAIYKWRAEDKDPRGLRSSLIYSLYQQPDGPLWVGTGAGLHRLDKPEGHFKPYSFPGVTGNYINAIAPGKPGELWLGTGQGVLRFDIASGAVRVYAPEPDVADGLAIKDPTTVLQDRLGRLWIGSDRNNIGLNLMDPSTGRVRRMRHVPSDPTSLPNDGVTSLHEDPKGRLWVGTRGGVAEIVTGSGGKVTFNTVAGTSDADIGGVLAIRSYSPADIWLSTTTGLLRMDPIKHTLVKYPVQDNTTETFNLGAGYASPDGVLYFGGTIGIVAVRPNMVGGVSVPPQVAITDLRVLNRSLSELPRLEGVLLKGSLTAPEELTLPPDGLVFSIEYAAMHFADSSKNRFVHRLDGFDREWVAGDASHHSATYTNLDPGRYVFHVRAANDQGLWGPQEASFVVNVQPPLWRTWWFRALLAVLVACVSLGLVWMRLRGLTYQKARLEALVGTRTSELESSNRKLEALSQTDGLTGLANRRAFDTALDAEWSRAAREVRPLSLAILDVDHFKRYNDQYGHVSGDQCLRDVAAVLQSYARRSGDLAARYGGEEFVFLAPEVGQDQARAFGEEICRAVEALGLRHSRSPFGVVTVSVGIVSLIPGPGLTPAEMVERADQALYSAKLGGRNRAEIFKANPSGYMASSPLV